jgi:hypothetical protein
MLKFGFKADEFNKFTEGEQVHSIFSDFFGAKYFSKLQRRYEGALSLEGGSNFAASARPPSWAAVAGRSKRDRWSVSADGCPPHLAPEANPPRRLNEIAIRFRGNGAPPRLYQHVIIWNTDREDHHRESRKFLELGRALQCAPKEMFDTKDWAIMLLWDEMPRGIPGLARWRDAAGLGCVKLICRDHVFSIERTAMV